MAISDRSAHKNGVGLRDEKAIHHKEDVHEETTHEAAARGQFATDLYVSLWHESNKFGSPLR